MHKHLPRLTHLLTVAHAQKTRTRVLYIEIQRRYTQHSYKTDDTSTAQTDTEERRLDQLYPGHIRTTLFQKTLLGLGSAAVAITSPWRDDMIATMGETTGYFALQSMRNKMLADPVGQHILEERPRINSHTVDLDYLRSLPDDTFGKEYVKFLDINNVTPDSRRDVMFVDDADLAYVMQRYREVHDLMHTVLGMPTNMLGEVVVKWFEAIQTGLPMCVTGALFGPVRLRRKHMERYLNTHLWWAIRTGQNAHFFMNVYYEDHWETPVPELRELLNIEEPPTTPQKIKR